MPSSSESSLLDEGKAGDNSERVLLTADGQRKTVLKTVVPITLGGRSCLLESFVDVSVLKQAQLDLQGAKNAAEQASQASGEG